MSDFTIGQIIVILLWSGIVSGISYSAGIEQGKIEKEDTNGKMD